MGTSKQFSSSQSPLRAQNNEPDRPQTRLDVDEGKGMTVTTGRVRREPVLDGIKYIALGHNLVRGGAGCSILNAELLLAEKIIK